VESPFDVFSTTSFILLVLLGLGFCLPPADYEMEVEAERTTLRCARVGVGRRWSRSCTSKARLHCSLASVGRIWEGGTR
jgi:hypothetical protein